MGCNVGRRDKPRLTKKLKQNQKPSAHVVSADRSAVESSTSSTRTACFVRYILGEQNFRVPPLLYEQITHKYQFQILKLGRLYRNFGTV